MQNMQKLRSQLRSRRAQLSVTKRRQASDCISQTILEHKQFRSGTRIACYWPVQNEVDLRGLIQQALLQRKQVYLPVLRGPALQQMQFAPYTTNSVMRPNQFAIPEPVTGSKQLLSGMDMDVVITPLLGFDMDKNRIGMGCGYYDRTFEFMLRRNHLIKPVLIGAAYECQRLQKISRQAWDIPLTTVITEQNIY